jgi:Predicted glycosyltransferases
LGHERGGIPDASQTILAVLVLYQMQASSSPAFESFLQALGETGLANQFRLLVCDNSAFHSSVPDTMPLYASYHHDPSNGGLTRAYSTALNIAEKEGHRWLLLLDQDTVINATYLKELWRQVFALSDNGRCVALAPKLLAKNVIISPARVLRFGRLSPVDKTFSGIAPGEIVALNSGTLLRVATVLELGGFNSEFWLDYLDHWIFNRLHHAGYLCYVMDAELSHTLS